MSSSFSVYPLPLLGPLERQPRFRLGTNGDDAQYLVPRRRPRYSSPFHYKGARFAETVTPENLFCKEKFRRCGLQGLSKPAEAAGSRHSLQVHLLSLYDVMAYSSYLLVECYTAEC